jgi:hypothetical protein
MLLHMRGPAVEEPAVPLRARHVWIGEPFCLERLLNHPEAVLQVVGRDSNALRTRPVHRRFPVEADLAGGTRLSVLLPTGKVFQAPREARMSTRPGAKASREGSTTYEVRPELSPFVRLHLSAGGNDRLGERGINPDRRVSVLHHESGVRQVPRDRVLHEVAVLVPTVRAALARRGLPPSGVRMPGSGVLLSSARAVRGAGR